MPSPDDDLLIQIEAHAAEIARGAGELLSGHFERLLRVDYKDEAESDPVTAADKETQAFLTDRILQRFPDHAVLGEEDEEDAGGDTSSLPRRREPIPGDPLPDFVWALDPLDGTRNFVAGLPVYSSSVGVLHRGVPVVGAVYVPWPGCEGRVFHARSGGPALLNGEPVSVKESEDRGGRELVALPYSFGRSYRLPRSTGRGLGEVRGTGSIAHELAMTASGVFEYTVVTRTHLWDVVAGMVLVKAAGGEVMIARGRDGIGSLLSTQTHWQPLDSIVDDWDAMTMKDLRAWRETLLIGTAASVRFPLAEPPHQTPPPPKAVKGAQPLLPNPPRLRAGW